MKTVTSYSKLVKGYTCDGFYDEMFDVDITPRETCKLLHEELLNLSLNDLEHVSHTAERSQLLAGITFSVYNNDQGTERIFPLDIIPRVISGNEWHRIEEGLKQRITALNLFINDVYHDRKIISDGVVPREIVLSSKGYLKECAGLTPPHGIWNHITGTDLVRDKDGTFYVLEDNLRCPSGVAYVLENREILKRIFPDLFKKLNIRIIIDYPERLFKLLKYISSDSEPEIAVLTPGIYNSAYFEHSFLARQMGVRLVEGRDLIVQYNKVYMKTTNGLKRTNVLYRRIDDMFMDPLTFRSDSLLGVPGLMEAYRCGNVSIANAPGTGVADDKVIYAYLPRIVKYYLDEDIKLPNVPTYICQSPKDRKYVMEHLSELVVKSANEAGGYGMLIGPASSAKELSDFKNRIDLNPRNYIAQPTLSLSRVPTLCKNTIEGRHVDLRPYILYGEDIYVMPGGLTRVALRKGSLVVNSSQGGGSKDTWVILDDNRG